MFCFIEKSWYLYQASQCQTFHVRKTLPTYSQGLLFIDIYQQLGLPRFRLQSRDFSNLWLLFVSMLRWLQQSTIEGVDYKQQVFISLEAGSVRLRYQWCRVLLRVLFWVAGCQLLASSHMEKRVRAFPRASSIRALILFTTAAFSWPSHFPRPSF